MMQRPPETAMNAPFLSLLMQQRCILYTLDQPPYTYRRKRLVTDSQFFSNFNKPQCCHRLYNSHEIFFQFSNAKNTFLLACKRSPSCVSWLGVGIACYRVRKNRVISLIQIYFIHQNNLLNAELQIMHFFFCISSWENLQKLRMLCQRLTS